MSIVYLNGTFLPIEQAQVSVLDRGFLFGDGVYEVVPVFGGRPFRMAQHLTRLDNSLRAVRMGNPLSNAQWQEIIATLLARNGGGEQTVYMQITRGAAPKRDHVLTTPVPQTVVAMSSPVVRNNREPVAAITCEDIRWKWCNVKAIALLPNVLMRMAAADAGAYEALLVRDGLVTEGAATNVFVVKGGVVSTPPHSQYLLPGVTRDLVVELLRANSMPCEERQIPVTDLDDADEIWISGSSREIAPVTKLNDRAVGDGAPGPIWRQTVSIYEQFRNAAVHAER